MTLTTIVEPHQGGHRYVILQGDRRLIVSGPFHFEADALRIGQHFAADPRGLFDFLER